MQVDQKTAVGSGLALLGLIGAAFAGVITWTTPDEQECRNRLTEVQVELADCRARLELTKQQLRLVQQQNAALREAVDSSKKALHECM